MNKDLRQFLGLVKSLGPDFYTEVNKPLKPEYQMCVIQQKLAAEKRFPVIYAPKIEGSDIPSVSNLFGAYETMGLALGMDAKSAKADIFKEYRKREANLKPVKNVAASSAPVKEVILKGKEADLGLLPISKQALLNSGKYIPIGCMVCRDPDTGIPNVGVYRHELKGKTRLGAMINPVNHGAYIARRYAELNKPMEVVIFIGHHPAVVLGALSKGPLGMNEFEVAGGLLGEPLEVVPAETVDLPVPAWAEIAIEGVIDARNMVTDGPFSEFAGYYGVANKPCWLIDVSAITMRQQPIYHDLDPSHREHNLAMVMANESRTIELVKSSVPSVIAIHYPPSGTCVFHAYISIKKRVQGEAKLAGLAAIAARPSVKLIVIVDEDVDVYDEEQVLWAVATKVQGDEDILIIPGVTGAHLDPTAYGEERSKRGPMSTHVIIDATRPVSLPFEIRIEPPPDLWKSMKLAEFLK